MCIRKGKRIRGNLERRLVWKKERKLANGERKYIKRGVLKGKKHKGESREGS